MAAGHARSDHRLLRPAAVASTSSWARSASRATAKATALRASEGQAKGSCLPCSMRPLLPCRARPPSMWQTTTRSGCSPRRCPTRPQPLPDRGRRRHPRRPRMLLARRRQAHARHPPRMPLKPEGASPPHRQGVRPPMHPLAAQRWPTRPAPSPRWPSRAGRRPRRLLLRVHPRASLQGTWQVTRQLLWRRCRRWQCRRWQCPRRRSQRRKRLRLLSHPRPGRRAAPLLSTPLPRATARAPQAASRPPRLIGQERLPTRSPLPPPPGWCRPSRCRHVQLATRGATKSRLRMPEGYPAGSQQLPRRPTPSEAAQWPAARFGWSPTFPRRPASHLPPAPRHLRALHRQQASAVLVARHVVPLLALLPVLLVVLLAAAVEAREAAVEAAARRQQWQSPTVAAAAHRRRGVRRAAPSSLGQGCLSASAPRLSACTSCRLWLRPACRERATTRWTPTS